MPEGDTIFRAARALREAIKGAEVLDVATTAPQLRSKGAARLVGRTVTEVQPRGKHLLIWFDPGGLALHSHLGMTGSWRVLAPGQPWPRPQPTARVVLRFADAVAVCFSAPVVDLLSRAQVQRHPVLAALGPDAVAAGTDLAEARRRLDQREDWSVGDALLDQRVLAGVGNIYKNEVCFLHGVGPWTRVGDLSPVKRDALLATAERLLKANAAPDSRRRTTTSGMSPGGSRLHVHGRARRPCLRCGTPIRVSRQGAMGRLAYWCPRCQGSGPGRGR